MNVGTPKHETTPSRSWDLQGRAEDSPDNDKRSVALASNLQLPPRSEKPTVPQSLLPMSATPGKWNNIFVQASPLQDRRLSHSSSIGWVRAPFRRQLSQEAADALLCYKGSEGGPDPALLVPADCHTSQASRLVLLQKLPSLKQTLDNENKI